MPAHTMIVFMQIPGGKERVGEQFTFLLEGDGLDLSNVWRSMSGLEGAYLPEARQK